jgi:hypothetical protein
LAEENDLMTTTTDALISRSLADHALRAFGRTGDGLAEIYLHATGGRVSIGGGSYGAQWIDSLEIDPALQDWIQDLVERLDAILDLDFAFAADRSSSNLDVYIDTEISVGSSGQVLGLAIPNSTRNRSWWELVINGPKLLADPAYLRFALAHELGHSLGLEHPFDASDGDSVGSAFSDPDASVTLMSYTRPPSGWPEWYQPADLTALVSLWGLEDDNGLQYWLLREPTGNVIKLDTQAAENRLSLDSGYLFVSAAPEGWVANAVPVAQVDRFQVVEDQSLSVPLADLLLNDIDPDGDQLELVFVSGMTVGGVSASARLDGGVLSLDPLTGLLVIPDSDFHGLLEAPYVLTDGIHQTEGRLTVAVAPVNDAPTVESVPFPVRVVLGSSFDVELPSGAFSDVDGDELAFSLCLDSPSGREALPDWLRFQADDVRLSGVAPTGLPDLSLSLVLVATDPSGLSVSLPIDLELEGVPLIPAPLELSGVSVPQSAPSLQSAAEPTAQLPLVSASGPAVLPSVGSPFAVSAAVPATPTASVESVQQAQNAPASVRLIRSSSAVIPSGEIGFAALGSARLTAQADPDEPSTPSVLVGSSFASRYVIARNGFTVIADNASPLSAAPNLRDEITGFDGKPSQWFAQQVGSFDLLLSKSAPATDPAAETLVLLADPYGRLGSANRLETFAFKRRGSRSRKLSLKRLQRELQLAPALNYGQLPGVLQQGLSATLQNGIPDESIHSLIAALHPGDSATF